MARINLPKIGDLYKSRENNTAKVVSVKSDSFGDFLIKYIYIDESYSYIHTQKLNDFNFYFKPYHPVEDEIKEWLK